MAAGLHGSARTTPRVRAERQASKESTRTLEARDGLNAKTVAKWRARQTTGDVAMGPRDPRSTVLSAAEGAMIVEFRQRTLLPLDDVMGCLRDAIPKLTRRALHRCLQRHGIFRLSVSEDTASKRGSFAETSMGFFHTDSCERRLAEGRLLMLLAIDRISKFTVVEFHENAGKIQGAAFLRQVVAAFPSKIHTVLTDNGMAFADLPNNRDRYPEMKALFGGQLFDRVCREHGIKHRLTKPCQPRTNGPAERMNRSIKDATSKTYHSPCRDALKAHILAFVSGYNFDKHLNALRWRTLFHSICDAWQRDPSSFTINPHLLIPGPGPNT